VNKVSWLLIRFMFVMAPLVFFINGFTKGDWVEACCSPCRWPWA
jgi:Mg2+-importing ATPase